MPRTSTNFTHSYSGYINYGCRCPICREANRVAVAGRRARAREHRYAAEAEGRVYVAEGIKHNANGYRNHHCRCVTCCADKILEDTNRPR